MMLARWSEAEVATADLGDERLDARLATLLAALGERPNLSIPAACKGRAEMQAAYRFFDNDKVTFDGVLRPHTERAVERLSREPVALLVQDTTEVDLTRPQQAVAGVGTLDGARAGFLLHLMHAFTAGGVPLGTVGAEVLNRTEGVTPVADQDRHRRQCVPIEDKESLRWLTGLRRARAIAQQHPGVECVCVADSEADIYELFAEPRGERPVHWLIRACQDRAVHGAGHGQLLRRQALAGPVLYEVEVLIRGRQPKTPAEVRARRQSRVTRRARIEVRAAAVTLRPPWRADRRLPPIAANVVVCREVDPPPGEAAVEWVLVTTLPIDAPEDVRRVVEYYCVRWNIEILFRVLKSGCRVEGRRLEHIDRVLPCLALYCIAAWRTLFVCRMGRACPEVDCEAVLEPSEWKAVWVAVHREAPPKKAPSLGVMVRLIARLGGYVERARGEPGPQTLWVGMQRMYDLAWAWDSFGPGTRRRGPARKTKGGP
jgi:hypothetical protein